MLQLIFGLISIEFPLIFFINKMNNAENGNLSRAFECLGFFVCATCSRRPKKGFAVV